MSKYNFTVDWFDGNIEPLREVFKELDFRSKQFTIVEVGCLEGRSSCWFIDNCLHHPDSILYCVDTWRFGGDIQHSDYKNTIIGCKARFHNNINNSSYPTKVVTCETSSVSFLYKLFQSKKQADIIYVDGSHTFNDVVADLYLCDNILAEEGIMIVDDYDSHLPEVKEATDLFLSTKPNYKHIEVEGHTYQKYLRKQNYK